MDSLYLAILVILLFWLIFRLVAIQMRKNTYRCPRCRGEFKPAKNQYVFFSYLKCPHCGKHSWMGVIHKG